MTEFSSPIQLPVLPLRDIVVFPHMIVPLFVGREKSVKALEGVMNENKISTYLGLRGIPPISEETQIARDIAILKYTGGNLHIPTISTAESVKLIRKAKKDKLNTSLREYLNFKNGKF